jgi:hypothetical protein
MPPFGGEVKPSVPCRRFAACKRSLNVTWKSTFRQNYRPTFSPTVPLLAARISRVLWMWRRLAVEIGTSKPWERGSGSHNKPIGCGASEAYALGPQFHLSLLGSLASYGRGGAWRRRWKRLKSQGIRVTQ